MRAISRLFSVVFLVGISGFLGCNTVQAMPGAIQVISSDAWGLVLELRLPDFTLETEQGPGGSYQEIKLPGWASTTEPGLPRLPVAAVLLQAPPTGGISFDIAEEEQQVRTGCRISPVPGLRPVEAVGREAAPQFRVGDAVLISGGFAPRTRVQISERQFVREDCLVRVSICPFQFDSSTGELRVSERMRVAIRFERPLSNPVNASNPISAEAQPGEDTFSRLLSRTVLNYAKREHEVSPQLFEITEHSQGGEGVPVMGQARAISGGPSGKMLKIENVRSGVYRITYEDLLANRIDPASIDPATLRMFHKESEVAIKVASALPGQLGPGDAVEFYVGSRKDSFTTTNVYWLTWGDGAGKRMESTDGSISGHAALINAFTDRVHFEENHVIWSFTPGAPVVDPWFWEKLTAPMTRDYTIHVRSLATDQSKAILKVALRGGTTMAPHPDHHTQILLNGVQIGDALWDGDIQYVHEMIIPEGVLKQGKNVVTVAMPGDTEPELDSVFLNWIELKYNRLLEAAGDRLFFNVKGEGRCQLAVWKLTSPDVRIFDITDSGAPREVLGASVRQVGNLYTATFQDSVDGSRRYLALTGNRVMRPKRLSTWKPSNLAGALNGADYILITSRPFLDSVAPLMEWHKSWGMRVKAVAVEDIYNEFNYGIFNPSAIKTFLKAAFANWQKPAPTYVLLVGDATGDYLGHLKTGKKNIVPPHLSITEGLGLTPDDGWFVSVVGNDPLPDMLIGRLSASTPEAAAEVAAKVVAYEKATDYTPDRALFVADNDEAEFEAISDELITMLPESISPRRVYLSKATSPGSARRAIINSINRGMLITNYVGHGNAFYWAAEKIFQDSDVADLSNAGKLTFVTSLDCYNGFFSHPSKYSLEELFVITPDKGAIGSFAPSGTGYPWEHELLGKALFSAVFGGDSILGSFTTRAKIEAYADGASEDLLKCYSLMGDPASMLKISK